MKAFFIFLVLALSIGAIMGCDDPKKQNLLVTPKSEAAQIACTTEPTDTGFTVICGTLEFDVCHGQDGQGVELIDPCGDNPGEFDEVIIRLPDRTLIAYFLDGEHEFLSVLGPGSYMTTDAQACRFEVDAELNIINETL